VTKAIVKGLIYVLLAAGILAMLQIGSEYFMFPVHTSFMQTKYNLLHNSVWHVALYTHIISSSVCIWSFHPNCKNKSVKGIIGFESVKLHT
jgi:hypothetical protein